MCDYNEKRKRYHIIKGEMTIRVSEMRVLLKYTNMLA